MQQRRLRVRVEAVGVCGGGGGAAAQRLLAGAGALQRDVGAVPHRRAHGERVRR